MIPEFPVAALSADCDFVTVCYIAAFSLFIFGVRQGTHPRTARRGNLIAAVGMLIAIAITLALDVIGNGVLIVIGILIGTIAVAFGAINIVGGFMVTDRMLGMFSRKPKPKAEADGKGGG